ncbi:MAG: FTR1 family protein [Bacillota bacterium]|nr:FTR1 family protein [Bacillota bacterium]
MLNVITISLRECLEMLIVIVSLLAYVVKIDKKYLMKYIIGGSLAGLGTSIVGGLIVYRQAEQLQGFSKDIFMGSMMLFLCFLILYYMVWIKNQQKFTEMSLEDKYNIKATALGLFAFSLLNVFRECIEIILFILPSIMQSLSILFGTLIGAALAILIMFLVYKTTLKLSLTIIFDILTLVLIFVGSLMFGEGLSLLIPLKTGSLETAGKLIFALPTLYLFLKGRLRKYIRKN